MKTFGLIGKSLQHSFSPGYFKMKFDKEKITDCVYNLFEIDSIDKFPQIIPDNKNLKGLNVTIPYKQLIIPYLNNLDEHAENIGAVNTIKFTFTKNNTILTGYNTDFLGFTDSIKPLIPNCNIKALILGTGGSSLAVAYSLDLMGIKYKFVSRNQINKEILSYTDLTEEIIKSHQLIINTTPLGMFPNLENQPEIPYQHINSSHILFDLIYNPSETNFLKYGRNSGAQTKNGLEMLGFQAEYSWKIWNNL
ncbi:MAG: shikimate dehydrogenase [Bacteroidales bacterium]